VHLVGFTIEIYHDTQHYKRHIYLININSDGTPTLVQGCGNMSSIKHRERRTENSKSHVFNSVAGYTTTINQLKCKKRTIYLQNCSEIIVQ
jgi:hypothetical protein